MTRDIDSSLNPLNIPYPLRQRKGGVTAFDITSNLLSFIISYKRIRNNAYQSTKSAKTRELNSSSPLTYFKIETLYERKEDGKGIHIILDKLMLLSNTGDGVAANKKTLRILFDFYSVRCTDVQMMFFQIFMMEWQLKMSAKMKGIVCPLPKVFVY